MAAGKHGNQEYTGVAVVNPNGQPVDVEFNFYHGRNRVPGAGDGAGADLHVYQGTLGAQGDHTILRGKRLELGPAGIVLQTSDFSATRLP